MNGDSFGYKVCSKTFRPMEKDLRYEREWMDLNSFIGGGLTCICASSSLTIDQVIIE